MTLSASLVTEHMNDSNEAGASLTWYANLTLLECDLLGFEWFSTKLLPVGRQLHRSQSRGNRVASILQLVGDVYFVVDCIEQALRWYRSACRKIRRNTELERQVAETEEMHAICQSGEQPNFISPSGDVGAELTIHDQRVYLAACNSIAMGRSLENEKLLTDSRPWARLLRSRWLATAGRNIESFKEFYTAIISSGELNLRAADWFFLPASCWEYAVLWTTLYDRRHCIRNLGLANFDHHKQLIGPPELEPLHLQTPGTWDRKVTEALIRFHLCRTTGDRPGLQRLSSQFPAWRDVSATLRFQKRYGRPPMKEELTKLILV